MERDPESGPPAVDLLPCPFCAEPIRADAKKCRHCQSMLVDGQGRPFVVGVAGGEAPPPGAAAPQRPTLVSLLVANLICPGLGTWRLGRRMRGFLVMAALLLAVLLYAQEALPLYQQVFQQALKGRVNAYNPEVARQLDAIIWHKVAIAVFVYSFIDVVLVYRST